MAQALGAKYVKISIKEENSDFSSQHGGMGGAIGVKGTSSLGVKVKKGSVSNNANSVEVAAEASFGGEPSELPELVFFRDENDISQLINMRMNSNSSNLIKTKTYIFKASNSSGMRIDDAIKIDAALKVMKCNVGKDIYSQARTESTQLFEYQIEF